MTDAERRISDLEAQLARLSADVSRLLGPFPRLFLAKDGDDAGHFQEQTVNDGEIVEFTAGRVSDEDDHPSNVIDPEDAYFLVEFDDFDDGTAVKRYVPIGRGGLIPVDVTTDGGDGDATPFSYTFTKKTGGDPLGTLTVPEWVFEPNVKVVAATNGTAYLNPDGVWTLYQVDEVPDDSDCP